MILTAFIAATNKYIVFFQNMQLSDYSCSVKLGVILVIEEEEEVVVVSIAATVCVCETVDTITDIHNNGVNTQKTTLKKIKLNNSVITKLAK